LFHQAADENEIPLSKVTRNYICPQIGGKTDVPKFLTGLELHGLGKLIQNCNDKPIFKLANKETLTEQKTINLFNNLDL